MSNTVVISTALRLPAPEIEALLQGRMIAAILNKFTPPGRQFALCPTDVSINVLSIERYYRSSSLTFAQNAIAQTNFQRVLLQPKQMNLLADEEQLQLPLLAYETVAIKAWARCELCQIMDNPKSLAALSPLTIWTTEALQEILAQRQNIFLVYLRVYQLSEPIEVLVKSNNQFVALPQPVTASNTNPVLTDRIFTQRQHQLQNLQPPLHPELEELQSAVASLAITNPAAKQLECDIQVFLGWISEQFVKQTDSDLGWINDIAKLGDRSIEQEEKKSSYQAGTDFENITRRSLEYLGFKAEEAYKGGAGGLDLFCSTPYPLVCECKAGRLIPSRTVEELLKLGGMHLGKIQLLTSAKLIIGPGKPSPDTLKAAKEWEVSIINAMTLQKLVELKAKYPGAINLLELKQYLESGQIDTQIEEYIQKTEKQIALRSHIIKAVKELGESERGHETVEIRVQYNAVFAKEKTLKLEDEAVHDLLIELSSPLTGYLGRIKGKDWRSERFYFLRNLPLT